MNALTTALLTRISEQLEAVGTTECVVPHDLVQMFDTIFRRMFSVNVLEVAQDTARGVQLDAFRKSWLSLFSSPFLLGFQASCGFRSQRWPYLLLFAV